jgi:hypothetical protein
MSAGLGRRWAKDLERVGVKRRCDRDNLDGSKMVTGWKKIIEWTNQLEPLELLLPNLDAQKGLRTGLTSVIISRVPGRQDSILCRRTRMEARPL